MPFANYAIQFLGKFHGCCSIARMSHLSSQDSREILTPINRATGIMYTVFLFSVFLKKTPVSSYYCYSDI